MASPSVAALAAASATTFSASSAAASASSPASSSASGSARGSSSISASDLASCVEIRADDARWKDIEMRGAESKFRRIHKAIEALMISKANGYDFVNVNDLHLDAAEVDALVAAGYNFSSEGLMFITSPPAYTKIFSSKFPSINTLLSAHKKTEKIAEHIRPQTPTDPFAPFAAPTKLGKGDCDFRDVYNTHVTCSKCGAMGKNPCLCPSRPQFLSHTDEPQYIQAIFPPPWSGTAAQVRLSQRTTARGHSNM